MLKNITKEQERYLELLEANPKFKELLDKASDNVTFSDVVVNLNDEEINYLSKIINDSNLRKQMSILTTYNFVQYIKAHGYSELLKLIDSFSNRFSLNNEDKIQRTKVIFDYIDYLIYHDAIIKATMGDKISKDALDALTSLKREIEERILNELTSENERLKSINKDLTKENESLLRSNRELTSSNKELSNSNRSLLNTRDSLQDEISSLDRQIDDKKIILSNNLDSEIEAERIRRISQIDEEIGIEKSRRSTDLITLSDAKEKLLLELQALESKLDSYGIKLSGNSYPISSTSSEVEVVWEKVDETRISKEIWKD